MIVLVNVCPACVWCGGRHHPLRHALGLSVRKLQQHYATASLFITVKPEGRS